MTAVAVAVLRVRAAAPVLLSLALIVVVSVTALGATSGLIRSGVAAGGPATLTAASAQDSAVRVSAILADDRAAQDAAARALFDRTLPAKTVEVSSSAVSRALPVLEGEQSGASLLFASLPDLAERVEFTAGAWPATAPDDGAAPVAVQADAAAALDLAPGDELTIGTESTPVRIRVEALWRASDPGAAAWFADSAATAGRTGGAVGLFVLDEAALAALPTQLFAVWTLTALPGAAADGDRQALVTALDRLPAAVDAAPGVSETAPDITGSLVATLDRIDAAGRGATAIGISALFIIGMLGFVAVLQLSTVLVGSRREHSGLLRARGLSRVQLAAATVGEGLLVVVPATAVAVVATGLLLGATVGGDPLAHALATVPFAVGTGLASVVVLAVVVLRERPTARGDRSAAALAVGFGAVGVAAALAVCQLHVQGSPVPPGSSGGADLVTATAPALALVALCALGTAAFVPLAPWISRRALRRGSIVAVLAGAQLAARATRYLVPTLAVAITVASAAFATGIATTWQSAQREAHLIGVGPDVEVALRTDATESADTEPVSSLRFGGVDGADAASAVVVSRVRLGSDSIPLVAIDPRAAETLLGAGGEELALALRAGDRAQDAAGVELPPESTGVQAVISFGKDRPVARFDVSIWAADADGSLARIPLVETPPAGSAPADDTAGDRDDDTEGDITTRAGVLPAGVAPWRILGVESRRVGAGTTAVSTLFADGFASVVDATATPLESVAEVKLRISGTAPTSRGAIAPQEEEPTSIPVVLTSALAARVDLGVGDDLAFGFGTSGALVDARVAALVDALPGAGSRFGIAVDIAQLNSATLQEGRTPVLASDVWIATDNPRAVSLAVTGVAASTAVVSTQRSETSAPILRAAMDAFWIAAAAAAVLALIALAAFAADDIRQRRGSVPVLRALGLSTAQQTAVRARELVVALAFAVVVGAVAGVGATVAAVTPFVAAAVPGAGSYVSVAAAFDPVPWLAFSAILVAAALLLIGVLAARIRSDVRRGEAGAVS